MMVMVLETMLTLTMTMTDSQTLTKMLVVLIQRLHQACLVTLTAMESVTH